MQVDVSCSFARSLPLCRVREQAPSREHRAEDGGKVNVVPEARQNLVFAAESLQKLRLRQSLDQLLDVVESPKCNCIGTGNDFFQQPGLPVLGGALEGEHVAGGDDRSTVGCVCVGDETGVAEKEGGGVTAHQQGDAVLVGHHQGQGAQA